MEMSLTVSFMSNKGKVLFHIIKKKPGSFNNAPLTTFIKNNAAPKFGLMFDIDGVIARGKKVIPGVPEAFRKLVDKNGYFRVPTTFLTNAGNGRIKEKAKQLTDWLNIPISDDKVIMAHTPLKKFSEYHNKCVLASGQVVKEVAKDIGFTKVVTVDELRKAFPQLDAVDRKRRESIVIREVPDFPKIESVLLIGEPVRWETSLQLILDVIMTDGVPSQPKKLTYPHMPVLACNTDLHWMAEANMPRFGHGAFILCLESLFKKITGKDLIYSVLVGKPCELTYQYAHHIILSQARRLGTLNVKRLYGIGDNINTDIFGANLYNNYLTKLRNQKNDTKSNTIKVVPLKDIKDYITGSSCYSVLVKTGVNIHDIIDAEIDHCHRDFIGTDKLFCQPAYTCENAVEAIDLILKEENFR